MVLAHHGSMYSIGHRPSKLMKCPLWPSEPGPLYHSPLSQITVPGVLFALSDTVGVGIFAELAQGEGRNCAAFLNVNGMPLPKSSLSQHFKVLRESGLIRSERNGVELKNYTRCDELQKVRKVDPNHPAGVPQGRVMTQTNSETRFA